MYIARRIAPPKPTSKITTGGCVLPALQATPTPTLSVLRVIITLTLLTAPVACASASAFILIGDIYTPKKVRARVNSLCPRKNVWFFSSSDYHKPTHLYLGMQRYIPQIFGRLRRLSFGSPVIILSRVSIRHPSSGNYGWFPTVQDTVFQRYSVSQL